jgi:SAM-dependent methyltransferase
MTTDPAVLCTRAEACRICGSTELHPVISLGEQYIASLFPTGPLPAELDHRFPLEVIRCVGDCGLVQLAHTVAPGVLYDHYGYRSGTNELMRANLEGIAATVESMIDLEPGDVVLDIGCNDGTLLESYRADGIRRIGIDPSDAVRSIRDPSIEVANTFFTGETYRSIAGDVRAKAVTTIAMFYDLDRPQEFVADVASILADDGVWVIELSYLPSMLQVTAFDTICHEHLEYYHLRPIEWLLKGAGLKVHRAEINDVNGGSIRLFVRSASMALDPGDSNDLDALKRREVALALDTDAPYNFFNESCTRMKEQLRSLLDRFDADDKIVYAYGASTKGNTLLQFCELDNAMVKKAADRNPDKWGTETIGTRIPIVSEDEARADKPDCFLVLPWHFFEGFIEREREFLERGGTFIVPLPEVRLFDRSNL